MGAIKFPHTSGNSMSIAAPATNPASDLELKLPATIGTAGQVLQNSSTPGTLEFGTIATGGITEIDCWRLNADIQHSPSEQWFTSSWERQDNPGGGASKLGTGMTETSGIFTFPSTGFWLMYAHWRFKNTGAEPEYHGYLQTSTDTDGTPDFYFPIDTTASFTDGTGTNYGNCTGVHVFDVTNTTHDKVRIGAWASSSSTYTSGHTNQNITYVYFIKLADT